MARAKPKRHNNGNFAKGNTSGGRKKGSKGKRTLLWEQLGEFIVTDGAELYMRNLREWMDSPDPKEKAMGMSMYKDTVEFFKPKLTRAQVEEKSDKTILIEHKEITEAEIIEGDSV
jgi:hypothetical protein